MNIQVAVLCDAATDDNGKLNLLGAFDTIYAPQLPAVHPQCSVALRVTFMSGDEGERKLKLNFVNADGRAIMPPSNSRCRSRCRTTRISSRAISSSTSSS